MTESLGDWKVGLLNKLGTYISNWNMAVRGVRGVGWSSDGFYG
jgi:hypothetical protein